MQAVGLRAFTSSLQLALLHQPSASVLWKHLSPQRARRIDILADILQLET